VAEHSHQPPPTLDQENPDQTGGRIPFGSQRTTRRPKPTAKAAEPQEPEPHPRKEREGRTPGGQAAEATTTNKPCEPIATERTHAADRKANAPTTPAWANRGAAAENTNNEREPAKAERTTESTPRAHPTETRQPDDGTADRANCKADNPAIEGEREPEKPTETTSENREESI
jgi:hypothetical protein